MRFALILAVVLLNVPLAQAQFYFKDTKPIALDLQTMNITSVIYSGQVGRALVGITMSNGTRIMRNFAECKAPRGPLSSEVSLSELSNCHVDELSWFEDSAENRKTFEKLMPMYLNENYERQYSFERIEANKITAFLYPATAAAALGITYKIGKDSLKMVFAAKPFGLLAIAGSTLVGVVSATWAGISINHLHYVFAGKIPSLESQTIKAYKELVAQHPETQRIDFKNVNWALNFNVVKTSIQQTIAGIIAQ